jgi:hypothetical protein
MKPFLMVAMISLVGCELGDRALFEECPEGETCSDVTPHGLHFLGADLAGQAFSLGPPATALGGTQGITLEYETADHDYRRLDQPYTAEADGGTGVTVDAAAGPIVTLRGIGSGTNYVRILERDAGTLLDRKRFSGGAIATISIIPGGAESVTEGDAIVFAPGPQEIGVALVGDVQDGSVSYTTRLVDESMDLALPGAVRTKWDVLELEASIGHVAVTVTPAQHPAETLDIEIVAGPATLVAHEPALPIIAGQVSFVCVSPHDAAGRHVAGLAWAFASDNGPVSNQFFSRNCAELTPDRAGPLNLTATAGGLTLTTSYVVAAAAAKPAARRTTAPLGATAGDRAAAN